MALALLEAAREVGYTEPVARRRAVRAVVCDGGQALRGRIEKAGDLVHVYKDYRGTTAAGLEAVERGGGFHEALLAAIQAGTKKAYRMAEDLGH